MSVNITSVHLRVKELEEDFVDLREFKAIMIKEFQRLKDEIHDLQFIIGFDRVNKMKDSRRINEMLAHPDNLMMDSNLKGELHSKLYKLQREAKLDKE